jgi:hypothetical protein
LGFNFNALNTNENLHDAILDHALRCYVFCWPEPTAFLFNLVIYFGIFPWANADSRSCLLSHPLLYDRIPRNWQKVRQLSAATATAVIVAVFFDIVIVQQ